MQSRPPNRYVPGQYYEIRVWAFLSRMQTNRYINAQTEIQTILSRMVIRGTHFMHRVRCVDCGRTRDLIPQQLLPLQPGTRYPARCHPDPNGNPRKICEPLGSREAFKNERGITEATPGE